jgi:hypothetical protein
MWQHLDVLSSGAVQPYNLELQRRRQHDSQHCRQHDLTSTSRHSQVTSVAPSPAWLDSSVASTTRHLHRDAAKSPRQHHHQLDSAALSLGRLNLYNRATTKLPRQPHHRCDSATLSPAWLSLYITPWPSRLGSAIAGMTQHLHCAAVKLPRQHHRQHDSTAPLPAWLSIYITSRPMSPW